MEKAHSEMLDLAADLHVEMFYSAFLKSAWKSQLSQVVDIITRAIQNLSSGYTVFVQCGGKGFRTDSILVSLLQVVNDPHYRTINGFLSLIEKDWVPHHLRSRCGFCYLFVFTCLPLPSLSRLVVSLSR